MLLPDSFDPAAVEMMRKIGTKAGLPKTHFIPFSMQTYDIMPPPTSVGGEIGEVRNDGGEGGAKDGFGSSAARYRVCQPLAAFSQVRVVNFTGVGLGLGEEVDVTDGEWAKGLGPDADAAARSEALTAYIQAKVIEDYKVRAWAEISEAAASHLPLPLLLRSSLQWWPGTPKTRCQRAAHVPGNLKRSWKLDKH